MTTATRPIDTKNAPSDIPPSRPVSRWVAAAILVGGATLQLIEEMPRHWLTLSGTPGAVGAPYG